VSTIKQRLRNDGGCGPKGRPDWGAHGRFRGAANSGVSGEMPRPTRNAAKAAADAYNLVSGERPCTSGSLACDAWSE